MSGRPGGGAGGGVLVLVLARGAAFALALLAASATGADAPEATSSAQGLRERYEALKADASSPFDLPLHLTSSQQAGKLAGDIYSRLDHRYEAVRASLRRPVRWCEIMILHPNVKGCRAIGPAGSDGGTLEVRIGRAEHAVSFAFRVLQATDDYLDVRLDAPSGPAGTTDYRIRVEATPLDAQRTLLHLAYSHGFGVQAKLAMDAYFGTFGRDKVGFSSTGPDAQGRPQYVRDLRGGLERNAMRYYLAIRSHLEVLALPLAQRLDEGLRRFVGYTERWPRQLKEEPDFLDVKRRDIARMRAGS